MKTLGALVALASCLLLLPATPGRAEQDHLVGMLVKELVPFQPSGSYTLQTSEGTQTCELKKVKFRLLQAEKNGGNDPNAGPAGEFLCYKAKCSGPFAASTTIDDQFGAHALEAKKTQLVCAPVNQPVCGDGNLDVGEDCDGTAPGICPAFCQANCTCGPACQATTGGFCWFLGAAGASCDSVCAAASGAYDPATASYAGSGGTDANCQAVLNALGSAQTFLPGGPCGDAYGCMAAAGLDTRCASPPTTSSATQSGVRRACACQ